MATAKYFASDIDVRPGDRVKLKRWWRFVDGTVVHVPGISTPKREFDAGAVQDIAIKTYDGLVYGVVIDPDTNCVREIVKFCERGEEPEPLPDVIDDPYIENE